MVKSRVNAYIFYCLNFDDIVLSSFLPSQTLSSSAELAVV